MIDKRDMNPEEQKARERAMREMIAAATYLYNSIPPGNTMEVIFPKQKIFVPGAPKGGRLIISKPVDVVMLQPIMGGANAEKEKNGAAVISKSTDSTK